MKAAAVLLWALAALAALAPAMTVACAPGGVCFRLSDCATGAACVAGACVALPSDAGSAVSQDGEVGSSSEDDAAAAVEGTDADDASADGDASSDAPSDSGVDAGDSSLSDDGG
jgi:hypothetical protein